MRGLLGAAAAVVLAGCQGCGAGAPETCAGPTPGVDQCVMPTVARDLAAGRSYAAATADAAHLCGTDEGTVGVIWAGWTQAAVIQGLEPKPIIGGDP